MPQLPHAQAEKNALGTVPEIRRYLIGVAVEEVRRRGLRRLMAQGAVLIELRGARKRRLHRSLAFIKARGGHVLIIKAAPLAGGHA